MNKVFVYWQITLMRSITYLQIGEKNMKHFCKKKKIKTT